MALKRDWDERVYGRRPTTTTGTTRLETRLIEESLIGPDPGPATARQALARAVHAACARDGRLTAGAETSQPRA
jgi:hypothetical protein